METVTLAKKDLEQRLETLQKETIAIEYILGNIFHDDLPIPINVKPAEDKEVKRKINTSTFKRWNQIKSYNELVEAEPLQILKWYALVEDLNYNEAYLKYQKLLEIPRQDYLKNARLRLWKYIQELHTENGSDII